MEGTSNTSTEGLREALASDEASIRLVHTFTHGRCVQVYNGRRKASPVIAPSEGQTLADMLAMLGHIAAGGQPTTPQPINIIFDGPPSHESGRFVEVELDDGRGIHAGEWIARPDGLWALRITGLPAASA